MGVGMEVWRRGKGADVAMERGQTRWSPLCGPSPPAPSCHHGHHASAPLLVKLLSFLTGCNLREYGTVWNVPHTPAPGGGPRTRESPLLCLRPVSLRCHCLYQRPLQEQSHRSWERSGPSFLRQKTEAWRHGVAAQSHSPRVAELA